MNYPEIQDFPEHYKGDALLSFTVTLFYPSGDPVDLTNAVSIIAQLRTLGSKLAFTFSSVPGADALLTYTLPNIIQFPKIPSWNIKPAIYNYDMQVTYTNGDVFTYTKGIWPVNQDITWTTIT